MPSLDVSWLQLGYLVRLMDRNASGTDAAHREIRELRDEIDHLWRTRHQDTPPSELDLMARGLI